MTCNHKRGDWIKEEGYWLCADCWEKMDSRPTRYGFTRPIPGAEYRSGPLQEIVWQAEIAQADGLTLNDFLRAMVRRYMRKTRPPMSQDDAYDAAIDVLKSLGDPYGDVAYSWDGDGARELADDDMQHWDRAEGNA